MKGRRVARQTSWKWQWLVFESTFHCWRGAHGAWDGAQRVLQQCAQTTMWTTCLLRKNTKLCARKVNGIANTVFNANIIAKCCATVEQTLQRYTNGSASLFLISCWGFVTLLAEQNFHTSIASAHVFALFVNRSAQTKNDSASIKACFDARSSPIIQTCTPALYIMWITMYLFLRSNNGPDMCTLYGPTIL